MVSIHCGQKDKHEQDFFYSPSVFRKKEGNTDLEQHRGEKIITEYSYVRNVPIDVNGLINSKQMKAIVC